MTILSTYRIIQYDNFIKTFRWNFITWFPYVPLFKGCLMQLSSNSTLTYVQRQKYYSTSYQSCTNLSRTDMHANYKLLIWQGNQKVSENTNILNRFKSQKFIIINQVQIGTTLEIHPKWLDVLFNEYIQI